VDWKELKYSNLPVEACGNKIRYIEVRLTSIEQPIIDSRSTALVMMVKRLGGGF